MGHDPNLESDCAVVLASCNHRSKLNRDRPCVPLKTLGQASVILVGWENWGASQLLESMLHSLGKSPPRAKCLSSVDGRNLLCRFHLENKNIRSTGVEGGSSFHSLGRVVTTQLCF